MITGFATQPRGPGGPTQLPGRRPGTPYVARNTEVHAAELQVWSSKPDVDGAVIDR